MTAGVLAIQFPFDQDEGGKKMSAASVTTSLEIDSWFIQLAFIDSLYSYIQSRGCGSASRTPIFNIFRISFWIFSSIRSELSTEDAMTTLIIEIDESLD